VTDDGPGITEAFQDSVFEKFIQTDSSTTRSVKGTGLGLSICKSIVTLHCGQIGLTSTPGAGATFYFLLPLQSAAHSSAVDSSSTDAEHEELGVYTGRD
jgi:signal transduction histidine kinase